MQKSGIHKQRPIPRYSADLCLAEETRKVRTKRRPSLLAEQDDRSDVSIRPNDDDRSLGHVDAVLGMHGSVLAHLR